MQVADFKLAYLKILLKVRNWTPMYKSPKYIEKFLKT